jgi:hypothetical protein
MQDTIFKFFIVTLIVTLFALPASGQDNPIAEDEQTTPVLEQEPSASAIETMDQENTLASCRDEGDNDGDGHVDCDDQDCSIFAICVEQPEVAPTPKSEPATEEIAATKEVVESEDEIIHRPFSIGFFPGLTTDGGSDGPTRNNFTLNFIGWGDYLSGFEVGQIGNIRKFDVRGFEAAGIFNHVQGDMTGFQGAGIYNFTNGSFKGLQGAGIASVIRGSASGLQGAGIATVSGGPSTGFRAAGIANVTTGHMTGFQGAGISNYSHSLKGVQVSGIANVAPGEVSGFQGGLINVGGSVKGAQVGLVNIATKKMKGAQIGLVNYAGDGVLAPALWASDTSLLNLGLKMGSRHVYSILGWGLHPIGDKDERRDSVIAGLGGHIDFKAPVWLELDLTTHWMHKDYNWRDAGADSIHKFRATVGFRVADQLSLFVGPTLNLLVSETREEADVIPTLWKGDGHDDDTNLALSIGFLGGLQWEPQWGNLNSH